MGQDDSSSEEAQSNHHQLVNNKPVVPPRPRSISASRNLIPGILSSNKLPKASNFSEDVPCKDNDIANADCK